MLFHEFSFLFLFLPLALAVYYALPQRLRNGWLLVGSCAFYGASSFQFLPILGISVLVDFLAGGRIANAEDVSSKRRWLLLSLGTNLGVLGIFKYAGFATQVARDIGFADVPLVEAALPVGISFYTFQSMSYSIDIYRGDAKPAESLWDFGAYVTLFPQLIAGPIVRYHELSDQLAEREHTADRFALGLQRFVIGLSKKLIIADTASALADPIFAAGDPTFIGAWVSMLLYAAQIYFDFSGYTDMARGLGQMLGFDFPLNFNSPYKATSFSDFWRRWHMSLSRWLRDNLYIPLGGNRRGEGRTYVNLAATMLLGGLWHGASWNFVIWGGLHGLYLAVERALGDPLKAAPGFVRRGFVFFWVLIAWVFFRLDTLDEALLWLGRMAVPDQAAGLVDGWHLGTLAVIYGVVWLSPNSDELELDLRPLQAMAAVGLFVACLFIGYGRGISPFLYFRF